MITRSEMIDMGIDIAHNVAPENTPLSIHVRGILHEFTRKLASKIEEKIEEKMAPRTCRGCNCELGLVYRCSTCIGDNYV